MSATVLDVTPVTPMVRRLVLGGPDVAAFRVPPGALAPYLKFHLPSQSGRELVRTYSVRHHDAARGELQIDVVLHGGDCAGANFACRARPGDRVRFFGPGHIPAPPCANLLVAGDHVALPAIAHLVENLADGTRVRAFVEIPGPDEEQDLAGSCAVEVTWLHRPHGAPSRLSDAVLGGWPEADDLLVWAGAEAAIARAIRCHARRTCGLPPARCQVLNYWKSGQPEGGFSYVD